MKSGKSIQHSIKMAANINLRSEHIMYVAKCAYVCPCVYVCVGTIVSLPDVLQTCCNNSHFLSQFCTIKSEQFLFRYFEAQNNIRTCH